MNAKLYSFYIIASFLITLSAHSATLDLKAGQRLTLVVSEDHPDGAKVREKYLNAVFPMAETYGFQSLQVFKVEETLVGDDKPEASGIYLWPNAKSAKSMRESEQYETLYKPLRSKAWKNLRAIDYDIPKSRSINIDGEKTYTLAEVWLKDENKYNQYYRDLSVVRESLGCKTLLKFKPNEYQAIVNGKDEPDLVVLLEWQNSDGPKAYLENEKFKAYLPTINQAINKINWYQLGFWDANY